MTAPRFGVAILNRLADRNEALAGDLLEGFQLKQSRVWFWKELIGAILNGSFRRSPLVRPIQLVEFPSIEIPLENFEATRQKLMTRGLSASPVNGVSGWTLVMVIWLITAVNPLLWVLLSMGLLAGVGIGVYRVQRRKRHPITAGADLTMLALSKRL